MADTGGRGDPHGDTLRLRQLLAPAHRADSEREPDADSEPDRDAKLLSLSLRVGIRRSLRVGVRLGFCVREPDAHPELERKPASEHVPKLGRVRS
jgi:hypothetical protein